MKESKRTRSRLPILCLFIVITLMVSVGAMAQLPVYDNVLVNGTNYTTANATVNCSRYAVDGVTCVKGHYYRSDGAINNSTWLDSWAYYNTPVVPGTGWATGIPNVTGEANWVAGDGVLASGAATARVCSGCHFPDTGYPNITADTQEGPNYFTTGHKNMLRKVGAAANGTALIWDDWTGATPIVEASSTYYIYGFINAPDAVGAGGNYTCARCHVTGYRFDGLGPEPTKLVNGVLTRIADSDMARVPSDGACSVIDPTTGKLAATYAACAANGGVWPTGSWSLSGIQCERCHDVDLQINGTGRPYAGTILYSGTNKTGGRVGHEGPSVNGGTNEKFPLSVNANGSTGFVKVGSASTALCIECHRQEVDTTPTTAGTTPDATGLSGAVAYNLGSIHPTQLPNSIGTLPTTTPIPGVTGNFAPVKDGGKCSDGSAKKYSACVAVLNNYWAFAPSMSHGSTGAEAFLNSPHALFVGSFDQTVQNSPDLSVTFTGTYNSFFSSYAEAIGSITAGTSGPATIAGDNGGCAGCHDVHNSVLPRNMTTQAGPLAAGSVPALTDESAPLVNQCTDCHSNNHYAPGAIAHSQGPGTPFANVSSGDPTTASDNCVVCHTVAAGGAATYHYFRINTSPTYYTFGPASALYATSDTPTTPFQPNTYAEADTNPVTYAPITYPAVGLDVDLVCGQCHGGGTQYVDANGVQHRVPTYSNVQTGQAPYFDRQTLSIFATGMHNTQVTKAQPVTFSQNQGTFKSGTSLAVTMKTMTTTAQICYTTDGSIPALTDTTSGDAAAVVVCSSTVNGVTVSPATAMTGTNGVAGPVTVTATTTVKAIAGGATTAGAAMTNSAVASATYTILAAPAVAPTISIAGTKGSNGYYPASSVVTLATSGGAIIYYTTNGQDPRISFTRTAGATLTLTPAKPAAITIKAVAKGSDGSYSPVSSVVYLVQ
jgi:hypothetical protein